MRIITIIFLILFLNFSNCQETAVNISNILSDLIVSSTQTQDILSNLSSIFSNNSINEILQIYDTNVNLVPLQELFKMETLCMQQFRLVSQGIENKELWALKMLDASAKLQPGILYGNIFHFGNYEECIEVNHHYIDDTIHNRENDIKGQYCSALIFLGVPGTNPFVKNSLNEQVKKVELENLRLSFGLCVPSGCTTQDLQNISNTITQNYLPEVNLMFMEDFCSTADKEVEVPTRSIIAIIIFASFGLVIFLGTFADACDMRGNSALLKCFSLYTNGKKLFTLSTSEDSLNCLNGIRVLSMMLIVLGHRFIISSGLPAVNAIYVKQWEDYWYNYIFIGLGYPVDTFFTVSGLLVVYLYMKSIEKGRDVSWPMFYLHRVLRLSPSLLMLVLFYSTMLQFLEHEPYPVFDFIIGDSCREYWWTTILYIQNYWNPNDMCAVHTWYLAIDTQIYIVAPLLLIALKKFPMKAIYGMMILAVLSMAAAFEVTWLWNLTATYLYQGPDEYQYLYTPTHIRIPPWLLGALTGYFIAKNKTKTFPLSKFTVISLWILSLASLLFVLLIQKYYHDYDYGRLESALFNSLARPIWGAAICMITLLCVFGHGGFINSFLSCSVFNIMIRINYSIYLLHMIVTAAIVAKLRTTTYLSAFYIIHEALGDYCIVIILATFWTLAFESPIIALEKLLLSKGEYGKDKYVLSYKSNGLKGSSETVIIK